MQKLINVLSLVSFCVSAGVVAGVSYVYVEKDNIIEDVKGKVAKEIEGESFLSDEHENARLVFIIRIRIRFRLRDTDILKDLTFSNVQLL